LRRFIRLGLVAFASATSLSALALDHGRWLGAREALYQDLAAMVDDVGAGRPVARRLDETLGRLMDLNGRVRGLDRKARLEALDFVIGGAFEDAVRSGVTAQERGRRNLRRLLLTLEAQSNLERKTMMQKHLRARVTSAGLKAALLGLLGTYAFEFAQAYVDWRSSFGVCPTEPSVLKTAVAAVRECSDMDLLAGLVTRNVVGAAAIWGVWRVPGRRRLSRNYVRPALAECMRALDLDEAGGPIL
jgi:hypothetical protein